MSRIIKPLNLNWQYTNSFDPKFIEQDYAGEEFELVSLPHMNQEIPYNYFDEKIYQFVSCYRKSFTLDSSYKNKSIYIDFEGVMTYAKVYLNGFYLGDHKGGYTPFSFNLTPHLHFDCENVLVVMVDSTEREDIPPFGFVIDYLTYGGIYREVSLRIVEPTFIQNVFARTSKVLSPEKEVEATIEIKNNTLGKTSVLVVAELLTLDNDLIEKNERTVLLDHKDDNLKLNIQNIKNLTLWDLDHPQLYSLRVRLFNPLDPVTLLDEYTTRIGFRTAEFTENGFFLNGSPIKILGLNRHQSFPYVGYAMPKRAQEKDADILKYELGLNLVRTSHYPQSKHFLNRCDEIGLLVFEEVPGWQHIGNHSWQQVALQNIEEMILRDFNHPSLIIWGVRINESPDDHDFYTATNQLAKKIDDTRQTGGVRCIPNSEFLEDVYTMNDFTLGDPAENRVLRPQQEVTGLTKNVPYLVTECNGHMYPTKRFDQEERLNEHALRHLAIHNAAGLDPHKCGAIAWCAFDYNTHFEFGSGDRICYHGVMDMFRIPKYAAAFYKSQISSDKEIVMEAVTRYARGERAVGGVAPLTIFTNCEKIELYADANLIGSYFPARDRYAGISYPPVIIDKIDGQWGMSFGDMTLVGYIQEKEVKRETFIKNPLPTKLSMVADDLVLTSGEIDSTRLIFKLLDQEGHELAYSDEIVHVKIDGPALLLGPSTFSLIGGVRGAWIKTLGSEGKIKIEASCSTLKADTVYIEVK